MAVARHAYHAMGKRGALRIEIALLPNKTLRALKKELIRPRVLPRIVDVLAFPWDESFPHTGKTRPLGEIYINETIARKRPARAAFLVIHGMLHLLGYRHDGKHDTIAMEREEERIFANLPHRLRG
jgi:rRNA maturation RNase YbeY